MDTTEDPDTEEALKGFDFLSSPDEMDTSPESRGTGDGTDWGESQNGVWNVYFLMHNNDLVFLIYK